jgi:LAS seventeen-binding protein 5
MAVLLSWHNQFKSDPSMTLVAGLYKQCRHQVAQPKDREIMDLWLPQPQDEERQRKEEEKERRREEEKERKRKEKEEREEEKRRLKAKNKPKTRREPFDFEKVRSSSDINLV